MNCKMELLPIMLHHKYGFIDKNGNIVIKPIYDDYKRNIHFHVVQLQYA